MYFLLLESQKRRLINNFKNMNKKISTAVAIVVIIFITVIAGIAIWFNQNGSSQIVQNTIPPKTKQENKATTEKQTIDQKQAQKNQNEKKSEVEGQQTYHNDKYGIEFTYPRSWGEVNIDEISDDFTDEEIFNPEDRSKISKISNVQKILSFSNADNYSIIISEYSNIKPYEAICNEGACSLSNIIDFKKDIEASSNIVIGGVKGKLQDEVYNPSNSLVRIYDVILPSYKLEIRAFHDASNLLTSRIPEKKVFLEDLIDLNKTEGVSLDKFIKELNLFVLTLKFAK